jgi:glutathionylspermidine synthase
MVGGAAASEPLARIATPAANAAGCFKTATGLARPSDQGGLLWHSGAQPYWNESAFYEFTNHEVDTLEAATNELAEMTLTAAQHIIDEKLYAKLGIPESVISLIEESWEAEPPSLYGRFDLAYDGAHPPKLLEYNADTPTSLLEAAAVQWYWLEDVFPGGDQFNSIHDRLIAQWKELTPCLPEGRIDFCSMDDVEDGMTVAYLMDTARQAGLLSTMFPIDEIAWDGTAFRAPDNRQLGAIFKLYPWEWMVREEFGPHLITAQSTAKTIWIEPPWKMLLSNKGILPVLWQLYPGHPNLLEAHFDVPGEMSAWVRKPLLGREGANITMHSAGGDLQTEGDYGEEGFVYQELARLTQFEGMYPVVGSWVIGQEAAGIGVRESSAPIITNTSQFVPHLFI